MSICAPHGHMYAVPREVRRGVRSPRTRATDLLAAMWVLGTQLHYPGRVASALNHLSSHKTIMCVCVLIKREKYAGWWW